MLILASKSPTRKTLLDNAGLAFSVASAQIDERGIEEELLTQGTTRTALARALAIAKARAVSKDNPGAVVIGADQTLEFGATILHKPGSIAEARARLLEMAGQPHALHSGVALVRDGAEIWSTVETATLVFKPFDAGTLDRVLALEGPKILDSVGAYRLEGPSVRLFSAISGDYFTILGLPLLALLAALETHCPDLL